MLRIALVLATWSCVQVVSAHDPNPIISPYIAIPPVIDGKVNDWDGASFIRVTPANGIFDGESATTNDANDLSFSFAVANDDTYLYVVALITDDIIVLDTNPDPGDKSARAWMDDAVEIFLDGDHSHSPDARDSDGVEFKTGGEFSIVANGAVTSKMSGVPRTNGNSDFWTSMGSYGPAGDAYTAPWDTTQKQFVVEGRFNYAIMDVGPGSTIGFTISAHDDDDGGGRDAALYWKGLGQSSWKDESGWGDLILGVPSVVEPTTLGTLKAISDSTDSNAR